MLDFFTPLFVVMKREYLHYRIRYFILFILISQGLFTSGQAKPEYTEVWYPEPRVVNPGNVNQPPSDAYILFDGTSMDEWIIPEGTVWVVQNGMITITPSDEKKLEPVRISTRKSFGDFQLHIEWKTPEEVSGEGQRRGNSGILIHGRYEIQVLDNFENRTYVNGQAGSVYKQFPPLVNACKKPGEWQSFDIVFTAPEFDRDGELIKPAMVTVLHNGILVQHAVTLKGSIRFIGMPEYEPHPHRLPLSLQDHGNAVSYRNIWIREL